MIHDWLGLSDFAKGKADAFAKQGYVALAIDLYRGKVATDPDMAHQLMRGLPDDRAVRDLKAAVAYLHTRPDVDAARINAAHTAKSARTREEKIPETIVAAMQKSARDINSGLAGLQVAVANDETYSPSQFEAALRHFRRILGL